MDVRLTSIGFSLDVHGTFAGFPFGSSGSRCIRIGFSLGSLNDVRLILIGMSLDGRWFPFIMLVGSWLGFHSMVLGSLLDFR